MELPKRCILMNAFFKAQFNYCPVVWMFHSPSLNNKINRLHERCLRIIHNDKHSNFEELLVKDNSVPIHHNNIHTLAIEIYKVASGICPEIMNDIFKVREQTHCNLRGTSQFLVDSILVFSMVVNQRLIWDLRFVKKYPLTLKIKNLLLDLTNKSKSGNP